MKNTDKKSKEAIELKDGAIVDSQIRELKINECFSPKIDLKHISPASIDLVLGKEIYRISRMTLPKAAETIRDTFKTMGATKIKEGDVLEVGVKYLYSLGKINKKLPKEIYGLMSPKSSTGRVDVHVKLLSDKVGLFDTLPENFIGELWLLVIPQSFPVIIPAGETLAQMRFFKGNAKCSLEEVNKLIDDGLVRDIKNKKLKREEVKIGRAGEVMMHLDLNPKNPGFVCRGSRDIVDLSKRNFYEMKDFFEKVELKNGGLVLEPGAFYILSTKEILHIPGGIAGEMATSNYKLGEFRAHYAGFFDPGFSAFGTLEVRSSEALFVYDGYPITEMIFEKTSQIPEVLYGDKKTVHYQGQVGPTLSKHFKK
jgi:dCTP deaminase